MSNNPENTQEQDDNARRQAAAQLSSIVAMVAALSVDYERLDELESEIEDKQNELELTELQAELSDLQAEYNELKEQANGNTSEDEAREAIQQDALSVEIRTGWYSPGEEPEPEEFNILLCTGGPAVRIRGELDQYNQPSRAWLEYQDWFTPWTEYFTQGEDNDALLTYCQQFYFGD